MFMEGTHVGKRSIIRVCGYSANGSDFQIKILMFPFILVVLIKNNANSICHTFDPVLMEEQTQHYSSYCHLWQLVLSLN